MVTDAAGAVAFSTRYKPFGIEYGTAGGDPKLRYTGQWKDADTVLYYLYRRFYGPELGRVLSQNAVLGHLTAPQSLDRYAYAVNNPSGTARVPIPLAASPSGAGALTGEGRAAASRSPSPLPWRRGAHR